MRFLIKLTVIILWLVSVFSFGMTGAIVGLGLRPAFDNMEGALMESNHYKYATYRGQS